MKRGVNIRSDADSDTMQAFLLLPVWKGVTGTAVLGGEGCAGHDCARNVQDMNVFDQVLVRNKGLLLSHSLPLARARALSLLSVHLCTRVQL